MVAKGVSERSLTRSLLPVDDFGEHVFAEEALALRGAKLVRRVLRRPLVVLVHQLVLEPVVHLLQLLAELGDGDRDRRQFATVISFLVAVAF